MTRFVILAVPRTGSNLLCTLLNSHPQILCHHEVFNPAGVFSAQGYDGRELAVASLQERDADPLGFLDRVWQTGTGNCCTGFKWTRGQNRTVLNRVVTDAGVRKIVLYRRNRIKTYVSETIAEETGQWEVYARRDLMMPRPRIHVDVEQLLQHIEINQQFYADLQTQLSRLRQPCLKIDYETLFDRHVQQGLLEFLSVSEPQRPLAAASVKQNSTDLRDVIANFAELDLCLSGKALHEELHDCGI